jgi:hypothetical protein
VTQARHFIGTLDQHLLSPRDAGNDDVRRVVDRHDERREVAV